MGKREEQRKQEPLWIARTELAGLERVRAGACMAHDRLPAAPGHPFYEKLSELLDGERFDAFVEVLSAGFYAPQFGRPWLLPGIYFRSLVIVYFEGAAAGRVTTSF